MLKAAKRVKDKTLILGNNAKALIDYMRQSGFAYTLKVSNYTTEVNSEILNRQFVTSMRSKRMFAAFSKIKSNVSKFERPYIDKGALRYFQHDFRQNAFFENVYNIDLKSAYANCLLKGGYITPETFNYISSIPKLDRLAACGMLASKKQVFHFDELNRLYKTEKIVSPLENFFFYCVMETDRIMNDLKLIAYEDYLFTWVDGIYIKPNDEKLFEIKNYLSNIDFPFSFDLLKNFDVRLVNNKIKLSFEKENKKKYFQISAVKNNFANDLLNFINFNLNETVLPQNEAGKNNGLHKLRNNL